MLVRLRSALIPFVEIQDMDRPVVEKLHARPDLNAAFDLADGGFIASGYGPQVGGVFLAPGKDRAAIRADGHEPHLVFVLESRSDRFARHLVPELGGPVIAASQDGSAVAADGQRSQRCHRVATAE